MGIPFSLSWNFIKGLRFFFFFQTKPQLSLGCAWLPGTCRDMPLGASRPASQLSSSVLFPEPEIRSLQHQPESGTSNLKRSRAAANTESPGGSAGGREPPLPAALWFSGLWLIIKGQRLEALFISTTQKEKKKKLMSSEHFTCCSPTYPGLL